MCFVFGPKIKPSTTRPKREGVCRPFAGHRLPMPAVSTGEDSSITRHSQAVPLFAVPDGIFTRSGGFLSCLSIKKAKRNPKNISTVRFEHNLLIRSQAPCPLGHADYLNDGGSVCARSYTVRLQKRLKHHPRAEIRGRGPWHGGSGAEGRPDGSPSAKIEGRAAKGR